jgi:potassium efflux system protein
MRIFAAILISLASGLTCTAGAASLPLLAQALQGTPQAEPPASRPEPAHLTVDWWRYFEVDTLELDQHIIETSKGLQALLEALPEATAAKAHPLVERIETNMDAFADARMRLDPKPPKPGDFQQTYTVSALADLMGRLHQARERLRVERADVASMDETIRPARRRIDSLLAAYVKMSFEDPDRVLSGLKIIAERLALAVAEEQLRLSSAALAISEGKVERLAAEQALAVKRLVAEKAELERLDEKITEAKLALAQAREQSVEERSRALEVLGTAPEDMATGRYRRQRVINAEVLEAEKAVRLIRLQAEHRFSALLLDEPATDLRSLSQQVSDWIEELADIRGRAEKWADVSREEWSRANEEYSEAGISRGGNVPLLRVLQRSRLDLAQQTLNALQDLERAIAQADSFISLLDNELLSRAGGWRERLAKGLRGLQQLGESVAEWTGISLFKIGGTPVTAAGILQMALILFVAWWISHWLRRTLHRLGERHPEENAALYTIGQLSHYLLFCIAVFVGLSFVGIDFTNFALLAGSIGIGIGFGLQSIVNNFVSGLVLLFDRSLKAGDFVELDSGTTGEVRAINVRSTVLNTNDNVDIVVPNSEFISSKVINWTLIEAHRRIHVPFKVAYGTNFDAVSRAALEAADRLPHTLKAKKPGVWLKQFGDSSLDYELVVWVVPAATKRPGAVHADYMREIHLALDRNGIEIPVPQRDLRLRSGFRELVQTAAGGDSGSSKPETGGARSLR